MAAAPARMKAAVQTRYGTTDVLSVEPVDVPTLADHGVLVRVHAAAVNPADWAILRGYPTVLRLAYGLSGPRLRTRGSDVAGVVEAIGAAVSQFQPGDEVFGWCRGAFAEFAAASETGLAHKPSKLTYGQAAAVPMAGITALQALRDHGHLAAGKRLLVNGAAGGIGTFAIQIAKARGAEVTGVCSARSAALVRDLGADHIIDYNAEDFTRSGERYDVVLDNVGNHTLSACRRALAADGVLIPNSMAGNRWFGSIGRILAALAMSPLSRQSLRPFFSIPKQSDLQELIDLIDAGAITPAIDTTYMLDDAPKAIAHVGEGHAHGKVIVAVDVASTGAAGDASS